MLITDLIEGGNLREYHRKRGWDQTEGLRHLRDVAEGMAYLESMKIVHGDLKASNILVDGDRAVISDFGLSRIRSGVTSVNARDMLKGTLAFIAPELFKGEPTRSPADVVVGDLVQKGERPVRPANISDDLWRLMRDCWEGTPKKRPTFVEVRQRLRIV